MSLRESFLKYHNHCFIWKYSALKLRVNNNKIILKFTIHNLGTGMTAIHDNL